MAPRSVAFLRGGPGLAWPGLLGPAPVQCSQWADLGGKTLQKLTGIYFHCQITIPDSTQPQHLIHTLVCVVVSGRLIALRAGSRL